MINKNHEYEFDFDNVNQYEINFALNTYSMILAENKVQELQNMECSCLLTEPYCNLNFTCNYNNEVFTTNKYIANHSYYQTWNNITSNGNLSFIGTRETIRNSKISNGTLYSSENINKTYENNYFENMSLIFENSSVLIENSVLNNSNIVLINSTLTLKDSNGTIELNNSILINYSNDINIIESENSTIYNYEIKTVYFVDNFQENVTISGNYVDDLKTRSFSLTNNITDWFLISKNTTFNFNTQYKYFNESVVLDSDVIVLTKTHIPFWDYSLNNSHMTDFRNYSLLENIGNISNVKLSRDNVNVSLIKNVNLSDANLSELFTTERSSHYLWFNVSISNFNVSFDFDFSGHIDVLYNDVFNHSFDSNFSYYNLSPGKYTFREVVERVRLGDFWVIQDAGYYFLLNKNKIISTNILNNIGNLFNNNSITNINKYQSTEIFYYSGNLFNDKNKIELIN